MLRKITSISYMKSSERIRDISVICFVSNRNSFIANCKIEKEANQFAVELLFPDELIAGHPEIDIYTLAHTFGIPYQLLYLKSVSIK